MHESSEVKVREIQCGGCHIQRVLQPAGMSGERERKGTVKHGITYHALSGYIDSATWETCCGDHAAGLPADISVHFSSVSDSALFSPSQLTLVPEPHGQISHSSFCPQETGLCAVFCSAFGLPLHNNSHEYSDL